MARNPDAIPVAANGDVYVAIASPELLLPIDDATTPPGPEFAALGYVSEDGVSFGFERETAEIPAWQSRQPVRKKVLSENITAAFTLLEWTSDSLTLAFGGGNWEDLGDGKWRFTLPRDDTKEFAIVIDALDGLRRYRVVMPRVSVEELDDVTFKGDEPAGLGITVEAMPDITGNSIYLLGDSGIVEEGDPEE